MVSDPGVTTTKTLRPEASVDGDVQEEIANYLGNDTGARQVARDIIRNLPPSAYTRIDSIVFYRVNGIRCEISCGTDGETKRRLLQYYLGKRTTVTEVQEDGSSKLVSSRVFFTKQPPGTEPTNPRWRCFVPNGTGRSCNKGLHEASEFLSHLMGFHRMESTTLFPKVIESLQLEAQKEVQPAVLRELGLEPEAFEAPTYHCKDQYPDCKRFFDSPQGRAMHQRTERSKKDPLHRLSRQQLAEGATEWEEPQADDGESAS